MVTLLTGVSIGLQVIRISGSGVRQAVFRSGSKTVWVELWFPPAELMMMAVMELDEVRANDCG